ncbi:MAG: hypothetical protein J0L70_02765 [Leptolyngbya sp. UWPOB_LEPTO1]|uniref:hypothetical protein n=1 Tax=Leptolyngbya sp. UWPOB_LEPTO1 TaxID=2815653 RepID=UPI001AC04BF8|nr:hypothetical protein [Leptolyngbya sp. UWPOB_LEPTO1]MBN8559426.1 hypothetical protein [Leptolyngbya sp. UWPOB_LEPTO1]
MKESDLDALLDTAFQQCESLGHPLSEEQKWILRTTLKQATRINPLDQLTPQQRQAFLQFAQENAEWKTVILNDWLESRDSGTVQFIRDEYGIEWLNSITADDLAAYRDSEAVLKIGDRIEVSSALWEWVQENDNEWVSCTVIGLNESENAQETSCVVRFDNGQEFEIQGLYDWNRSNWR